MATDWRYLFPDLPARSEAHRRTKWLWGATGHHSLAGETAEPSARPGLVGARLPARFGLCAAKGKHAWFYGFRLVLYTGLLDQAPRV